MHCDDEHFGENPYSLFIRELALLPGRPTPEEERLLFERVAHGDHEARDRLVTGHLHFVIFLALKYRGNGVELTDRVQAGSIGLIRAVAKFRPEAQIAFSTYAAYHVRDCILRCIEDARFVQLPGNLQARLKRLRSAYATLLQEKGREPSIEELAREAKVTDLYARDFLILSNFEPLSLETTIHDDDGEERTLGDLLQAPPLVVPEKDLAEKARKLLSQLPEDERRVLIMFFGLDPGRAKMSDAEIAQALNLNAKKVYRIRHRALQRLSLSSTAWEIISGL